MLDTERLQSLSGGEAAGAAARVAKAVKREPEAWHPSAGDELGTQSRSADGWPVPAAAAGKGAGLSPLSVESSQLEAEKAALLGVTVEEYRTRPVLPSHGLQTGLGLPVPQRSAGAALAGLPTPALRPMPPPPKPAPAPAAAQQPRLATSGDGVRRPAVAGESLPRPATSGDEQPIARRRAHRGGSPTEQWRQSGRAGSPKAELARLRAGAAALDPAVRSTYTPAAL
jgi:hypothetical protein